jgi:RimJ/RimL family protein N-acetyltransferase
MTAIPALETKRLRLRAHKLEDFADCAAMWADPIMTRYIGGTPSTEQQVWSRMTGYLGHWSLMGFGYRAIEEKETDKYIGEIGFADFKRDVEPSIKGIPEVGWALASRMHGQGYAAEALQASVAWGDARFGLVRTVCLINPANLPSIRVAEKCGYRRIQQALYKGEATGLYSREPGTRSGASLDA